MAPQACCLILQSSTHLSSTSDRRRQQQEQRPSGGHTCQERVTSLEAELAEAQNEAKDIHTKCSDLEAALDGPP